MEGCADDDTNVPLQVTSYFSYRDELSLQYGPVFHGERVVIPSTTRGASLRVPPGRSRLPALGEIIYVLAQPKVGSIPFLQFNPKILQLR